MSEQFFILQVSAAEGAEEFYITSNNHTRMEPVEQARKLDRITQQVSCNVSVKSKLQHAPPPPGQPPGHLTFLKIIVQIPPYPGQNAIQMPHTRVY